MALEEILKRQDVPEDVKEEIREKIAEMRNTGNVLRESEEKFSKIFNTSPNPIMIIDIDNGCFTDVNQAMIHNSEYSREELIGKNAKEIGLVNQDSGVQIRKLLAENGEFSNLETIIRTKSGKQRFGYSTGQIIEINKHKYIIQIVSDFTERRIAEKSLQESQDKLIQNERRLSYALSATSDSIWEWDYISGKTYYSSRWYEMLGYEDQELEMSFDTWKNLCHPDDYQSTIKKITSVLDDPKSKGYNAEFRMLQKNGNWVWIQGRGNVVKRDEDLKPLLLSGTNTDISERKRNEEILRESEAQFKALFENASDGIIYLSTKTEIVDLNNSFANMHGYTVEEMKKMRLKDLDIENITEVSKERIRRTLDGENLKFNVKHLHKRGHIIDLEVSTCLVSFENQNLITAFHRDITERKRAEEALNKSESRLRTLINSTPDIICFKDGQGRWLIANDADLELFCLKNVDYLGKTDLELSEFTAPIYKDAFLNCANSDEKAWQAKIISRGEETITKVDGIKKVYDVLKIPVFEDDGNRRGLVVLGRDTTEKKLTEEALLENEKRLKDAQRIGQLGSLDWDLNTNLLILSDESFSIFGFNQKENPVSIERILERVHPSDTQRVNQALKSALAGKESYDIEHRILRPSGEERFIQATAELFNDQDGNPVRILETIHDITERKKAERDLAETKILLNAAFNQSPVPMGLASVPDYKFRMINNAAAEFLKIDASEYIGKSLDKISITWKDMSPEGKELNASELPMPLALNGISTKNMEIMVLREDNTIRWEIISGTPIFNEEGTLIAGMIVFPDITERKLVEKDLIETNIKLEKTMVKLEETQRQIVQQEKLRSLGQMTSGICHDINNSLTPIMGYIDLLRDDEDLMKRNEKEFNMIIKSTKNIARTIDRLKDFYKNKLSEENLYEKDINKIIMNTIELTAHRWKNMAESTGLVIEIKTDFQMDLPTVRIDESEIMEALTNLILNACDAMPDGGTLHFKTTQIVDKISIELTDTGIGMDAETLEHCIEPFFTTKGNQGTGLGLSMVYGVIERHEGEIMIDSHKNNGTTVKIILPINMTKDEKKLISDISSFSASLKILVVEDDEIISGMLKQILLKRNHSIEISKNGKEALKMFIQEQRTGRPFNLVITDLGMPEMDGISLSKILKKTSPGLPIILLTGWGTLMNKDEHPSIDCLLKKPILQEDLIRAINELFKEK